MVVYCFFNTLASNGYNPTDLSNMVKTAIVQTRYFIGTQKSVGKQETGNNLIGYYLGLWGPTGRGTLASKWLFSKY